MRFLILLLAASALANDPTTLGNKKFESNDWNNDPNKIVPTAKPAKPKGISGKCVIAQKLATIEVPCPASVTAVLMDSKNKVLSKASIEQGRFQFSTEVKHCFLKVESDRYHLKDKKIGPLQPGDVTILKVYDK